MPVHFFFHFLQSPNTTCCAISVIALGNLTRSVVSGGLFEVSSRRIFAPCDGRRQYMLSLIDVFADITRR